MEYAPHLPNPRSVLVPALALVIGAGGAIAVSTALDDADVSVDAPRIVVTETPATPGEGVAAKHESTTAAAISRPGSSSSLAGKDEAATAAAISRPGSSSSLAGKDEAATAAAISRPGSSSSLAGKDEAASAAAMATSSPRTWLESKDESKTAAAVGIDQQTANRTDPHGPAAALP